MALRVRLVEHMTDARSVAAVRIADRLRRFPDLDLTPIETDGLDDRDASLARAIDGAVHRRWVTLRAVTDHFTKPRRVDDQVQAILMVGAAQLLLLDRLPDHAVIHQAVEWIRHGAKKPKATGYVNAVLRRIADLRVELMPEGDPTSSDQLVRSDGTAWRLATSIIPNLATQTSFPGACWAMMVDAIGEADAGSVAIGSIAKPPILLTGSDPLPDVLEPHEQRGFGVLPEGQAPGALLSDHPDLRVQDPTSAAALELARDLRPGRILDQCAGRGTKTRQMLAMFPDAQITATEPNSERRSLLQSSLGDRIAILEPGGEGPSEPFDLVLADVPCSNSGVLARRPEARYRLDEAHRNSVVELQRQILGESLGVVSSGGHVLYATCSIDPAENQAQTRWLEGRGLALVAERSALPTGRPGSPPSTWRDGGYAALLRVTPRV